jgi:transposase-like protein
MSILPTPALATTTSRHAPCAARRLDPQQRQRLALAALTGHSISRLARRHRVSRRFIYRQQRRAQDALDGTFAPAPPPAEKVLFYLPITRAWLEQFVLALLLICHCSLRGVQELLRDLFDYRRSVGSLHNLAHQAIAKATARNARQDLSAVHVAALDEIFQTAKPILTVVDVASTYCCLLSLEEHRDANTWGVRLLELQAQGFAPHTTIADGGKGLRAGVAQALPAIPCRADVFHAVLDVGAVVRFLENRAYAAITTYDNWERQVQSNQPHEPAGDEGARCQSREEARHTRDRAVALADDVAVLAGWLRRDVLAVAGPCLRQRLELFDFVLNELQARVALCPHRLGPLCKALRKQKHALLAFVEELDRDIGSLAAYACVPEEVVRELVAVQELPPVNAARWQREGALRARLGERYHALSVLVERLRGEVVRASSVVENVPSRVRNYCCLRREVGGGYLELLRFFLNQRRFLRSEHVERVGRSPAELLTGQPQPHWLEALGYQLFRRAG